MASKSQPLETARKAPLFCLGCGSDVSNQAADRSLQSDASKHIVAVWKSLLQELVSQEESDIDIDADSLAIGGGDPVQGGRMYRKCFAAYDRFKTL